MPYSLSKLAAGSYDVFLNGVVIAGLVRTKTRMGASWTAELLELHPAGERPPPFSEQEHEFATFEEACAWLGVPEADLKAAMR